MTKKQLAESYLYDLYNAADHADKLTRCARVELESGDYAAALESLKRIQDGPGRMLEMHVRDAIRAVERAQQDPEAAA